MFIALEQPTLSLYTPKNLKDPPEAVILMKKLLLLCWDEVAAVGRIDLIPAFSQGAINWELAVNMGLGVEETSQDTTGQPAS